MRKHIIAGNWKMNLNLNEGYSLASEIKGMVIDEITNLNAEVVLFPPFIHLAGIKKLIEGSAVMLGAQNCHYKDSGAFTGEISPKMLKELGVKYVLVGHSERRQYNFENNQILAMKVSAVLSNNLHPVYCIGETLNERENKNEFIVNQTQLNEGLFHLLPSQIKETVIAYEPVWAIGTGITASVAQAAEMHNFIRKLVEEKYGTQVADEIRILYGGSMKPDNAAQLLSCNDIDGGLIGGASLESRSFVNIVKAVKS
ncbi:MAG: triose-phosphate isomerase [Bacteroidetes bacterium]|nr:triose-phosphate isomerase [Bacteroidota bacterium]